jgi:hypothetical protein
MPNKNQIFLNYETENKATIIFLSRKGSCQLKHLSVCSHCFMKFIEGIFCINANGECLEFKPETNNATF